jgi:hypothetical protein
MKGYVARRGDRWYPLIYEGLDPAIGKQRRRWHPERTSREGAKRLAARLAAEMNGRDEGGRSGSLLSSVYTPRRWTSALTTTSGITRKPWPTPPCSKQ